MRTTIALFVSFLALIHLSADELSRKEDYSKGIELYQSGQFDEAAKHLESFLAADPSNDEILRRLKESSTMALVEMQHNKKLRGIALKILRIPEESSRKLMLDDERTLELVRDIERRQYSRDGQILKATWDAQRKLKVVGAPAVPFLIDHLGNTHEDALRSVVYQTIIEIDQQAVLPLIQALNHPNSLIQTNVIAALGHIGDPLAIPAIKTKWENTENSRVKSACAKAILNITNQSIDALPNARVLYLKQADDYLKQHPRILRKINDDIFLVWSYDHENNKVRRTEVPGYIWHLEMAEEACYRALATPGQINDSDIYPLLTITYYSQLEIIENLIDKAKSKGESTDALVKHHHSLRKADLFGPLFGSSTLHKALKIALSNNNSGLVRRINNALVAINADLASVKE